MGGWTDTNSSSITNQISNEELKNKTFLLMEVGETSLRFQLRPVQECSKVGC